ncbi:CAP domain-containing protein [Pyxidicoccus xibeiensis]|uniref:CAP domain-containing protein n=1 Tax=Pyxidicoccus xibeiensis TaxID=2906759 RepID=UPI0020A8328C|nr:CAP domain-containing protein [Pyxidicoccus xibeiensis]MCP3140115.1 CAP domain-containing protein [Pyxidicoccus xibeiensis]
MRHSPMRHLLALGLVVPWLSTGCGSDESTPDDGETPQEQPTLTQFERDMLDTHNTVRAGVTTPRPDPALEALTWDVAAEAVAKAHVAKCNFRHNGERGDFGENIAAATPDLWDTPDVVNEWAKEVADYDYARNTCAAGKQCGHYTQVVWRATKRVGCATQVCTTNSPFGSRAPTWQFWVCNYAPPGNYVGQRPY